MSQSIDRDHEPRPAQFTTLGREIHPPDALEERVVSALRDADLLRPRGASAPRQSVFRTAAVAAGVLLMVLLGVAGGRLTAVAPVEPQADYMLLVMPGPAETAKPDADAELKRFQEYSAWYRSLASKGEMVGGDKLSDDPGIVLVGDARGGVSRERPGTGGAIEGFFLIRARSEVEARRIASSCPHLRYGGVIELRRIDRPEDDS
jgi:hypothetical protein